MSASCVFAALGGAIKTLADVAGRDPLRAACFAVELGERDKNKVRMFLPRAVAVLELQLGVKMSVRLNVVGVWHRRGRVRHATTE